MNYEDIKLLRELDPKERDDRILDVFSNVRKEVSVKLKKILEEKKISVYNLARELGYNSALFWRIINEREFALSPKALEKLCYEVLNISCHEFIFGCKETSFLSKELSLIANILMSDNNLKKNILETLRNSQLDFSNTGDIKVARKRLKELAEDNYIYIDELFDRGTKRSLKITLRMNIEDENYNCGLKILMYYAFRFNTSLDYFITQDFIGYSTDIKNPVCLFGDESKTPITDNDVLEILSKYLILPEEKQKDLFSQISSKYIKRQAAL